MNTEEITYELYIDRGPNGRGDGVELIKGDFTCIEDVYDWLKVANKAPEIESKLFITKRSVIIELVEKVGHPMDRFKALLDTYNDIIRNTWYNSLYLVDGSTPDSLMLNSSTGERVFTGSLNEAINHLHFALKLVPLAY